jgi:hypothetical protein
MATAPKGSRQEQLNKAMPIAAKVKLGDVIGDLITQNNMLLDDLTALRAKLNTNMLTKPGLAIKTGGSTLAKAATACVALVAGAPVYIAANTDMSALAGTLATANSAAWAFYVDSAGVITTSTKTADVATHALAVAALPAPPSGKAMIGFIVVSNATGSNFVGGTTALDAASLTVTYYDAVGPAVFAGALTATTVAGLETRT